jgi:hypothetical protein
MSSRRFVVQKLIGREFEQALMPVLEEMGFRVIDVDHWGYKHKKGRDIIVEVKGTRCSLELKYDLMSEKTVYVCLDLDSINKTDSAIWLYGLPRGNEIDVYSVRISDLAPFARNWPVKRLLGEFKQSCALVKKETFLSQPFVFKFKTINLN